MPYRTILVGTDGSDTAERAVAEAAELSKAFGAKLVIASAYHQQSPAEIAVTEDESSPAESWVATTASGAEDVVLQGREVAARHGVETVGRAVPGDRPGVAMLDAADDIEADLVVVGNKGMTGAKRFLLGSVPDFIAHHADCDVLIARTAD